MVDAYPNPDYKGVWTNKGSYAIFSMWLKGMGNAVIWECYNREWIEARVEGFSIDTQGGISFIKRYFPQKPNMISGEIKYSGEKDKKSGLFRGNWSGKNIDGNSVIGNFVLADSKDEKAVKELERIVGSFEFSGLSFMIREKQKEFPFTPII